MRGFFILVGALAIIASAGCAKKESTSSQSAEQSAPSVQPPAEATHEVPTGGHAENEQVNTSGSIADIVGRVHEQEQQLDQIIASAQLSEVHKKAFAIRDLVVAAAAKAAITGADKAKLDEHVSKVRSLASELDEAGDAGNLSKTKAGFAELRAELQAVRQLLGSHQ